MSNILLTKGSFVLGKTTPRIIPANENTYELSNDSGQNSSWEVIPGETNGA